MNILNSILNGILTSRQLINYVLVLGSAFIVYLSLQYGIVFAAAFSIIPLLFYASILAIGNPKGTFYVVFIINYFLIGIMRYIPSFKSGVVLDALLISVLTILLFKSMHQQVKWKAGINILSILAAIWFIYCSFELFNPMGVTTAWARSIRGISTYFLIVAILVPIIIPTFKDFKRLMMILSILTLISVLKVIIQKYYGFDLYEKRWLYLDGGAVTHIIHSGVRYFSFFSDAANYGAAMGFASVIFAIQSAYCDKKWNKYYYIIITLAALYGLILSGTRGAVFIPIVGIIVWIILSRDIKKIVIGTAITIAIFVFLLYSEMGNGNSYIRRTRSALNKEDASLLVRQENQRKLKEIMTDLPFGTGIGMGGGKAKVFAPDAPISQIPTDSWFVLLWVETGIVGLILNLAIQLSIMIYGAYLVFFKLRNPVVKGCITSLVCALSGAIVASYGNEIWGQLPNIFIFTACQAFIILSPQYDKELTTKEEDQKCQLT